MISQKPGKGSLLIAACGRTLSRNGTGGLVPDQEVAVTKKMDSIRQVAIAACVAVALVALASIDGPAARAFFTWAGSAWDITPGLLALPGPL